MTFTFVSNFLNHHQLPFCSAMYHVLEKGYVMVSTVPMSKARMSMGWKKSEAASFELRSYLSKEALEKAHEIIDSSDVVMLGSAPDAFMSNRLKQKKLTFRYAERFYKTGKPLHRLLRDAGAAWLHHGRFQKYPLYLLCASAYTAADAARFGNYKNRCYKWGYFPPTKTYAEGELLQSKTHSVPRLLWVGRFLELKHPDHVLIVVSRLKNAGYNLQLDLIGSGPLEQKLRYLIAKLDLDDCVRLLGSMSPEAVREHMEQANIYLFTSDHNEGWGAVLNESMNSGCAVVASHAIGSVPYLLKNGENGLIYESENIDSLFRQVKYLLDNPLEQIRLGQNAYQTITEVWNAEEASRRLLKLAEDLQNSTVSSRYADGPCSKAEILKDDWFTDEE